MKKNGSQKGSDKNLEQSVDSLGTAPVVPLAVITGRNPLQGIPKRKKRKKRAEELLKRMKDVGLE